MAKLITDFKVKFTVVITKRNKIGIMLIGFVCKVFNINCVLDFELEASK